MMIQLMISGKGFEHVKQHFDPKPASGKKVILEALKFIASTLSKVDSSKFSEDQLQTHEKVS